MASSKRISFLIVAVYVYVPMSMTTFLTNNFIALAFSLTFLITIVVFVVVVVAKEQVRENRLNNVLLDLVFDRRGRQVHVVVESVGALDLLIQMLTLEHPHP
ncbi:hypothetical protein, variant [Aphanomyces astaci]|uniref:Transmembrane protein n=1 Tax=Aphanomyces astaci TaxID=112090 RepID=W4GBG1_APHAT|nr:hypothetical protein H257_08933 [Aphanomyces astaci]XP_009833324.1 hypothetical protein, variant [Aphanomyces astaci]ETV77017.1 hypothetical protein H257_08933 [Aphanomyces astaci]ETV77018.1 hypothetical protein, variant [Aphanomyces astaci]|eukprot:XP_009833323.1 hypothetical protein H257_08933 [Aphanomyces astaci]